MKNRSPHVLAIVIIMILLSSGCGTGTTPMPVGTVLPEGQTPSSIPSLTSTPALTATSTGITRTPLIPITGENVVFMQCQFCVDEEAHAVLIFPEFAFFDVVATTPVSCLTADVVNGQRILLCRGAQQTSFNLKICSDNTNCLEFPVALQSCPLVPEGTPQVTSTPFAPFFLTPINTLDPPDDNPTASTGTPVAPTLTIVPTTATTPPAATTEPPATQATEPSPTSGPTEPPAPTETTTGPTSTKQN